MYCRNCGKEIADDARFCVECGASVDGTANVITTTPQQQPQVVIVRAESPVIQNTASYIRCPRCGGSNVSIQTMQEQRGGKTITKTKTKYKEKRHGLMWWLFVGWWWSFIDLFTWIFAFFPRVLLHIGRKRTYVGKGKSIATTNNKISYQTICTCQSCGNSWRR